MEAHHTDVAVVGGGPAGRLAALACAEQGLAVTLLAAGAGEWPATYGLWLDEADGRLTAGDLEGRWERALVDVGSARLSLPGPYVRLDGVALRRRLFDQARQLGMREHDSRVVAARGEPHATTLGTDDGTQVCARVVVDATGHEPALLQRGDDEPAVQAAFGLRAHLAGDPYPPGSLALMDFRDGHLDPSERPHDPTFCYAMDYGDGTWFVEETSLARRPPLPTAVLEDRLRRRLAWLGADPVAETQREHVAIPLGRRLPRRDQRIVGFGAAAGMVHPATGYQLGAAIRTAPRLAQALADALADPHAPAATVARAGWQALWPAPAVRAHALHRYGLEALLRLDAPATRRFFAAFFSLPEDAWRGYLSGTVPPAQAARCMTAVLWRADPRVRRRLLGAAWRRPGRRALADLLRER